MVFCRWVEHKEEPELCSDPEDRPEFDQRNHDEVEERRAIELTGIQTRERVSTEGIDARMRSRAQGGNRAVRSSNREQKRAGQDMAINVGVGAIDDDVDGRRQVWLEGYIHLGGITWRDQTGAGWHALHLRRERQMPGQGQGEQRREDDAEQR